MKYVAVVLFALFAVSGFAGEHGTKKDVVEVAMSAGSFETLAAALQAAGLVDTLKGAGPFTVFAPTDEAFAALPKGTLDKLLLPADKAKLQQVLTYHVVSGRLNAAQVVKLTSSGTVNGAPLSIVTSGKGVRVGDANVVKTDIPASNGVIHVIDRVLLPPGLEL